jgi:myo-inositol-1(or 4)-monophosphatase
MMMNYQLITKQASNIARVIGAYLKEESHKVQSADIKEKGIHDYVTYVDLEAEKRLVTELGKLIPGVGFIAEENKDLLKSEGYNWVIDPLDGTTNYIHSIPVYCISIALMYKDEVVSGVVYEVNTQECFHAWKDSPAFLNRNEIRVSSQASLNESLFATGFPYYDYSRMDDYLEVFKHLMKASRGIRRLGSAALDLAYVAAGRFDGFYEYGLQSWDVAAGSFIVQQAGGVVSDFSGQKNYIFGNEIVACNAAIYTAFYEIIAAKFK